MTVQRMPVCKTDVKPNMMMTMMMLTMVYTQLILSFIWQELGIFF